MLIDEFCKTNYYRGTNTENIKVRYQNGLFLVAKSFFPRKILITTSFEMGKFSCKLVFLLEKFSQLLVLKWEFFKMIPKLVNIKILHQTA